MTPTLESALAALPAKPRVHELAKLVGLSNKDLLSTLSDRGLTLRSPSASVPAATAREVIDSLLGGPTVSAPTVSAPTVSAPTVSAPTDSAPDAEPAAPTPPIDQSPAADLINPLFLPPEPAPSAPAKTRRSRTKPSPKAPTGPTTADPSDTADTAVSEDAPVAADALSPDSATGPDGQADPDEQPAVRSGQGRRRRGRSGSRRPTEDDKPDDTADQPNSNQPNSDQGGSETAAADQASEAESGGPGGSPTNTDTDTEIDFKGSGSGDSAAEADEDSARGRRRRRGRRGRGRVTESDTDSDTDSDADSDTGSESDTPTGPESTDATDAGPQGAVGQPGDTDSDDNAEDESDDDSADDADASSGSGNRRRRRRRRRSTGDEAPRDDDPDNTVVHVREPRLSAAGGSARASSSADEVQGVRGSTRLEAKRQRRRDSRDSSRRRPQILTEAEFLTRRESVERVMAVRQRGGLAQVALLEDGILVEHFVSQTGSDSMIGSVFLGKVQNVLPSMEAAFVDIGQGRNAVIYAGEVNWDAAGLNGKSRRIETALSSGDTILAQVSKDPVGHKGARLTTQISLPGRFLVYVPNGGATGISRKLPDTERRRLKSILDRIVPEDAGVIIRTAAEGIAEEELARDVERLKSQWEEISRRAEKKSGAPTQLYAEPGTLLKVVRDLFNSDITRLVVDGDEAYQPVADYVSAVAPELADRLVRYESATQNGPDVFAAYRIDEQIAKALERKVHLPSGGSLVIDRTEAMTVVDVNTGKYTGSGGNLEETVTKNNLEAAEEIVRQLRLRDIGGIIVVDFIDMVLESNRELVLRRLTEALGRDRTRHQVAEVTSLGLVQMTRKRMGTGLVEAFSEPCPHCSGRGLVLHDLPVVASDDADDAGERRSGKARRSRGRDSERVEEAFVPRVVEQAAGRRPDPRGPKPPSPTNQTVPTTDVAATDYPDATAATGGQAVVAAEPPVDANDDRAPSGRGGGRSRSRRGGRNAAPETPADELSWIEAAARSGIAAAADADDDDFDGSAAGGPRRHRRAGQHA